MKIFNMNYNAVVILFLQISFAINPIQGYDFSNDFNAPPVSGYRIPLGFISDLNSDLLRQTFELAIKIINDDLPVPLVGQDQQIPYGDSMQGVRVLCDMMQSGVGGIFGPTARTTGHHLMSLCDSKDLPYLFSHMSEAEEGYNLHPHPLDIAKALHAVIAGLEWTRFIYLYENTEYLGVLNALMSSYHVGGPVVTVMRYDLNLNGNYKSVLRRIRKASEKHILMMGSTESLAELLKQAQQVGMVNDDYKYIIGSLDFQTFDLEEYKFSEANITAFRMFSSEQPEVQRLMVELGFIQESDEGEMMKNGSCPITTEMALLYDGVIAFAEATKYVQYAPQPLNCSTYSDNVQQDGSTFKNYMRSLALDKFTISGQIYFDGAARKGYKLDVIELQQSGLVKVGTWEENKNFTFDRPPVIKPITFLDDNSMINKTFRVLISVPNKPYAMLKETHKKLDGNDQYDGYSIGLIQALAEKLGFNYTLIDGGNDYGSFNRTTNVTTGMLKELVEGRADLAMTDLTITSERQEVIDFSIPFMNLGISILYLRPQKSEPTTFSFMDPFSKQVWKYLGIAFMGVSLCFFVLGRLSPTEWDNPYPCIEEPEELENQFTINNALWFTTGAFLQQGSEIAPKALSTRTVAAIWCFFTLIIVSSYTANLAAFLTVENPTTVLDSVKDLADNKGGVVYGCKRNGATKNFFANPADPVYQKMKEYLDMNPDLLTESNEQGVERVKSSDAKSGNTYAFLMESTSIDYNTFRDCKLMKVGEPLDEKSYGIAMPKSKYLEHFYKLINEEFNTPADWPYRNAFNNALLELQEQNVLADLKRKWWIDLGAVVCNSKSGGDNKPLAVANLEGIYYVLIVGSALSIIYGTVLWCFQVAAKARSYRVSFRGAIVEEFKSVVNVTRNERVVRGAASIYSQSRHSSLDSIESLSTDSVNNDAASIEESD